jgi:hypothetical protein
MPRNSADNAVLALHRALARAQQTGLRPVLRSQVDWAGFDKSSKGAKRPPLAEMPRIEVPDRPDPSELTVLLFPQTWGSTALGYGGLGGAAVTDAYTVVVRKRAELCVYFGTGPLAYHCMLDEATQEQVDSWNEDLGAFRLTSRRDAVERYGATVAPAHLASAKA